MKPIDSRQVLWANLVALMQCRWGAENLNRLAREAGIGPATAARIKGQQTSVGLEVIDAVAQAFSLEAWQLLVPGLDPLHLPTLLPMSEAELAFYERMLMAAREFKDATP